MEHLPDFTAYIVALYRTFNASQYPLEPQSRTDTVSRCGAEIVLLKRMAAVIILCKRDTLQKLKVR